MNSVGQCRFAAVSVGLSLCAVVLAAPVRAQQPDMQEMMKWARVTVVHYDVAGEFKGEAMIMTAGGGFNERAQVTDRVEFAFDWNQQTMEFVGQPKIQNFPSTLGAIKAIPTCPAAKPSGPYEHWTVLGMKAVAGSVELSVRTDYAPGQMPVVCGGSWKTVPTSSTTETELWGVPAATVMAMPPSANMTKSKDGKSFIVTKDEWTWTFTPRPVK
jgi:hypothetical protein